MKRDLACSTPVLLHPATLVALALWALNDHLLKGWGPSALTGKLSDVAALMVCPALLFGIAEWGAPDLVQRRPRALIIACCAATGLFFIGLELWPPIEQLYRDTLTSLYQALQGSIARLSGQRAPAVLVGATADVTDLLCLPALAVPAWLVMQGEPGCSSTEGFTRLEPGPGVSSGSGQ